MFLVSMFYVLGIYVLSSWYLCSVTAVLSGYLVYYSASNTHNTRMMLNSELRSAIPALLLTDLTARRYGLPKLFLDIFSNIAIMARYKFIKNADRDSAIGILSGEARRLTLSRLDKNFSIRLIEMFFLSSPYGDTLHKISKPVFWGK